MRLSKKLFLIFCLCFPFSAAQAQYRFDSWTADNGLPQNSVYSIQQTPDGYLWLTTLDGLVRFDGVRFTVFNKSNSKGLTTNRFTSLLAETDRHTLARHGRKRFGAFSQRAVSDFYDCRRSAVK